MFEISSALILGKGPFGETPAEIRSYILDIMKPYNMHHVPSEEMEELDLNCFYLAISEKGKYVGACGYKIMPDGSGKTTLLSVLPEFAKHGIGLALQKARVNQMTKLGVKHVITNADRPETIAWYKKQGYYAVGQLPKVHSFGLDTVPHWTTLRLDL